MLLERKELLHDAIESIRNSTEICREHYKKGEKEYVSEWLERIHGKTSLLEDMNIISMEKWRWLDEIIDRMIWE